MEKLFLQQQEWGLEQVLRKCLGKCLERLHNSQSDPKMFLISLEPLRNVVRNGYSHCRHSGLRELRTLGRLWVVIPTGSPGLEQLQSQLWDPPRPLTASPGTSGHGHSCGEPQTPVRGGRGCSLPQWNQQAGKGRQLWEALSPWNAVQTLVWREKHSQ